MNLLLGTGNVLRGDDGVGNYIAQHFSADNWRSLDCGTAPENFSSVIRRERPAVLVLVDAADLGVDPGEFRRVNKSRIRDVSIGTHTLPLSHFIEFIQDCAGEVIFIGIQPALIADGVGLTERVKSGADRLIAEIREGGIGSIAEFQVDKTTVFPDENVTY